MKTSVFAVRDSKVGAFNQPLFFRSRGEAVRSFSDAVNKSENGFLAHADDYDFWFIGEFDDSDGRLLPAPPERVCGASDFVLPPSTLGMA